MPVTLGLTGGRFGHGWHYYTELGTGQIPDLALNCRADGIIIMLWRCRKFYQTTYECYYARLVGLRVSWGADQAYPHAQSTQSLI